MRCLGAASDGEAWIGFAGGEEGFIAHEQPVGCQQGAYRIALQQGVTGAGVAPEGAQCGRHVAMREDEGVRRQIIEKVCRLLEEQRQVVLDAGTGDAGGNVLVDAGTARVALEGFAERLAEAGAPGLVHGEFARRQQADFGDWVQTALGIHVESLDAFDFVAEKINAERECSPHREKVDQTAADGVFARRDHLRDVGVAGPRDLGAKLVRINVFAFLEGECIGCQIVRRRQPVQCGGGRHHNDVQGVLRDAPQGGQALRYQILVR